MLETPNQTPFTDPAERAIERFARCLLLCKEEIEHAPDREAAIQEIGNLVMDLENEDTTTPGADLERIGVLVCALWAREWGTRG